MAAKERLRDLIAQSQRMSLAPYDETKDVYCLAMTDFPRDPRSLTSLDPGFFLGIYMTPIQDTASFPTLCYLTFTLSEDPRDMCCIH